MAAPVPIRPLPTPDGTAKHGTRYSAQDHESAYQVYRQLRSLRRVAEELSVSPSTLSAWSKEQGWVGRADREDGEDIAAARTAISATALPIMQRGVARMGKIIDNPESKDFDATRALELLAKLTGTLAAPNAGQPFISEPNPSGRKIVSLKELAELSPDELAAWSEGDDEAEPTA